MRYCWMWSFKDRPAFSAIIKLLDSSLHLASTEAICAPELDVSEYNRQAGLVPPGLPATAPPAGEQQVEYL